MKILLTNDDGIEAPGLRALYDSVVTLLGEPTDDVIVVAPDRGRSECGHSVTTGRPLTVRQQTTGWHAVDGTPVDCVRAALTTLAPDIDIVLSGVNAGANLGVDLLVSGTFAAAREAALHQVPAMAVSHYRRPDVPATWDHVPQWLASPLADFFGRFAAQGRGKPQRSTHPLLWNVNLPAIDPASAEPSIVRCEVDSQPLDRRSKSVGKELHFSADFHGRPRDRGRDVEHCFSGSITVSELTPRIA